MYGPYNANPLYSTNSFFRTSNSFPNVYPFTNATYGPWGYRNAGMMPNFNNGSNNNSTNQGIHNPQDEPDNADPSANTMNSPNPYQAPPAPPAKPPAFVPSSGGASSTASYGGQSDSRNYGRSGASSYSSASGTAASTSSPYSSPGQPAPIAQSGSGSRRHHAPPAVPASAQSSTQPSGPASNLSEAAEAHAGQAVQASAQAVSKPLAEGFINHLNGNYQGDMSKALGNSDTRSWAQAMGIIGDDVQDGSHLSQDRLDVLGRLLKDNSLDPVSKLDTMRILLKKSPGGTN